MKMNVFRHVIFSPGLILRENGTASNTYISREGVKTGSGDVMSS